eukprot:gene30011-37157_t
MYTPVPAFECQICPAGSRAVAATTCEACPANFYSTADNSLSCTACAAEFLVSKTSEMYTEVLARLRVMTVLCQRAAEQKRLADLERGTPLWKQLCPHPRKILQYGLGFVRVMLFFNTNGHAASSANCDAAIPVVAMEAGGSSDGLAGEIESPAEQVDLNFATALSQEESPYLMRDDEEKNSLQLRQFDM